MMSMATEFVTSSKYLAVQMNLHSTTQKKQQMMMDLVYHQYMGVPIQLDFVIIILTQILMMDHVTMSLV